MLCFVFLLCLFMCGHNGPNKRYKGNLYEASIMISTKKTFCQIIITSSVNGNMFPFYQVGMFTTVYAYCISKSCHVTTNQHRNYTKTSHRYMNLRSCWVLAMPKIPPWHFDCRHREGIVVVVIACTCLLSFCKCPLGMNNTSGNTSYNKQYLYCMNK